MFQLQQFPTRLEYSNVMAGLLPIAHSLLSVTFDFTFNHLLEFLLYIYLWLSLQVLLLEISIAPPYQIYENLKRSLG